MAQDQLPLSSLHFTHYTMSDGLLSTSHITIYQDSRKYMWLGSTQGLQRFDGAHFVNYLEKEMSVSTSDNPGVLSVIEDRHHNIVAGTSEGVFVKRDGSSHFDRARIVASANDSTAHVAPIYALVIAADGHVWFKDYAWIYMLSDEGEVMPVKKVSYVANRNYASLTVDADGLLWFTNAEGFHAFDPMTQSFVDDKLPLLQKLNGLSFSAPPSGILFTKTHLLAHQTWGDTLTIVDLRTLEVSRITFPDSVIETTSGNRHVASVACDRHDHVWVSFHEHLGIARLNPRLDRFESLYPHSDDPLGLHDDIYMGLGGGKVFVDNGDRIWYEGIRGLNVCAPYDQPYRYFRNVSSSPSITESPTANSFCRMSNGDVYVGFYGTGLVRYSDNFTRSYQYPLSIGGNKTEAIWTVFTPDSVHVIATTQFRQALEVNTQTGSVKVLEGGVWDLRQVSSVYVESDTLIWLGMFARGLTKYNYRTGAFINYDSVCFPDRPGRITVHAIRPAPNNGLWLFTDIDAVVLFDREVEKVVRKIPIAGDDIPTPKGGYISGGEASDSHIFIATSKGLLVYNLAREQYMAFTRQQGLAANACLAVLHNPRENCVWVNTAAGLCKLDLSDNTIRNYASIMAAADNRGDIALMTLPNKDLLLSVASGFIKLDPHGLLAQPPPEVRITQLFINASDVNYDSLSHTSAALRLRPFENNIHINFSAMLMPNNPGITYKVFLEGADADWTNVGSESYVEYRSLSSGNYTFHVMAVNSNGEESPAETVLAFSIKPYFWNTRAFWLGVIVLIGAGVYYFIHRRQRQKHRVAVEQEQLRRQLQEAENMALRAQMNPHFIFNCLNSINLFIADNNTEAATQYLSRFAKLIRLILDNSASELIPLSKELSALQLYIEMELLRFESKFSYNIRVAETVNKDAIQVPPLLVQPFVENAIWHGLMLQPNDPRLNITVEQKNGHVTILVDDNGIGRERSREIRRQSVLVRKSIGMELAKNRLDHLNTQYNSTAHYTVIDKTNASGESTGTRVEIELPLIQQ